jgi:3-dehydroquinate dehydratase-2
MVALAKHRHGEKMTKPIYVLNGPNLNRLGTREPHIYGSTTLAQVEAMCREASPEWPIVFRQSNREYELVDWIHEAIDEGSAIIINPAAFTFTSMAIMDALKMFAGPIIELHISNIHKREPIYHKSYMSAVVTAVIAGLGTNGYPTAVKAVRALIEAAPKA